jgi:histidyl-tRNA synthetase
LSDRFLYGMFAPTGEQLEQIPEVLRCVDKLDKIGIDGVTQLMIERNIDEGFRKNVIELLSWGTGDALLEKIAGRSDEAAASVKFWRRLIDTIVALGVPQEKVVFDPSIARGLDYYTSTVFEFSLTGVEGYGSIVGGGRYNDLLSTFSDKTMPAVGGALGIDRLYEYLEATGKLPNASGVEVVVLNMGEATWGDTVRVATGLRAVGVNVDLYYDQAKLEKQFKYGEAKGARLAIMMGEEEKAKGVVKVKNLQTREQVEVQESELLNAVTQR